jgi:hypothetical protein
LVGVPELFAQNLLDARDRLVDRLLGADALGDDAVDRLRPDCLLVDQLVPPMVSVHCVPTTATFLPLHYRVDQGLEGEHSR